jgi:hypothetical protein
VNIETYQQKVIELFQSGKATKEQWREMARAVLNQSEGEESNVVLEIDLVIDPEGVRIGEEK